MRQRKGKRERKWENGKRFSRKKLGKSKKRSKVLVKSPDASDPKAKHANLRLHRRLLEISQCHKSYGAVS